MSGHLTLKDLPQEGERFDTKHVSKWQSVFLAVGVLSLLGCVYFLFSEKWQAKFAYSWLFAFFVFFTLSLGGLFWTMVHHATNSGWGVSVRRVMESVANMVPFVAIFALPLLLPPVREALWEWMGIVRHATEEGKALKKVSYLLYQKSWYLNMPFFFFRFFAYFLILTFIVKVLRGWSIRQDQDGDGKYTLKTRRWSCGFIPLFAVCITFAAIDWLMGLDWEWFSTMWGVYLFAGSALSSMSLIVIIVSLLQRFGYLQKVVTPEHYHIMGKLMFSFTVFWAYISFSQYFLIWYANIPEETKFFTIRNTEGWNTYAMLLVLFHFVIPFIILLIQPIKVRPRLLAFVGVWIIFTHVMDMYFIVIPERGPSLGYGPTIPGGFFLDLLPLVGMGCLFAFVYLKSITKHSLYPCKDPRLLESVNLSN